MNTNFLNILWIKIGFIKKENLSNRLFFKSLNYSKKYTNKI